MKHPYANTPAAKFIYRRINEISHRKTQQEMAQQAGFKNSNLITQLKLGSSKLALDRVPGLAKALEVDPALLMRLTPEQSVGTTAAAARSNASVNPSQKTNRAGATRFAMLLTMATQDWPDGLGQPCGGFLANERYPLHHTPSHGPELGATD